MYSLVEKEISKREIFYLLIALVMSIGFQLVVIIMFPKYAVLLIVFFILLLISLIAYLGYIKDFSTFLLIINFLPLLLLDNNLHYEMALERLSFFPLVLLVLLSLGKYFLTEKNFSIHISYIELPVILMTIYFGINAVVAIYIGKNLNWILNEYIHFCLYLIIIPVLYLLREREKYFIVLKFLLLVSILISLQYIIFNLFVYEGRFVTFQSGFLPLTIGAVFAYFLFTKGIIRKTGAVILLALLITGTFVTLTRTLWVTSFLVVLTVLLVYLKIHNKLTFLRTTFLLLTLIVPVLMFKDSVIQTQTKIAKSESVEERTQSVSKPLEDASFLMRIELGYYAVQRFLEKPIFGHGLGDFVNYKVFSGITFPIYYLDNAWLYVLWKGGIIGFLLFAWLYIRFFRAAFFILKNSPSTKVKIVCLGLIGGFIGLSFLAILSPLLIKYKTNALIAFLFAFVEFERFYLLKQRRLLPLE